MSKEREIKIRAQISTSDNWVQVDPLTEIVNIGIGTNYNIWQIDCQRVGAQ